MRMRFEKGSEARRPKGAPRDGHGQARQRAADDATVHDADLGRGPAGLRPTCLARSDVGAVHRGAMHEPPSALPRACRTGPGYMYYRPPPLALAQRCSRAGCSLPNAVTKLSVLPSRSIPTSSASAPTSAPS